MPATYPNGPQDKLVDDTASICKQRYLLSSQYTQPYFERFLDNYKHYFLRIIDEAVEADPDSYPFYSQIMLPITYQIVETILPRMFSRLPNYHITSDQQNEQADLQAFENLIKYQMNHPYLMDDPTFSRMVGFLKETFITGNAWGMVPWYMKQVDVMDWIPYSPQMNIQPDPNADKTAVNQAITQYGLQPQYKLMKVNKRVFDAPVFQHKSIFHVYPDPKKRRASDLGYLIIEENMTMDQLMDMVNVSPNDYKQIDLLKQLPPYQTNNIRRNWDNELASMFGSVDYAAKDTTQGQYYVQFMMEPDKYSIIINESLTIRESDNPNGDGKLGIILQKDIPIPGELYAWGEPDPIKRMEDAMTDQFNMRSDNVFYSLMRMWKLNPNALVDGEEFIPEPGSVVQMTDLDGLQPIDPGNTKMEAYKEYQEWNEVIQNVTGASDYATGNVDAGMNKTMGGVQALQQAANARFQLKLQLFEQIGLKSMGIMYIQRNLRFFDTPQHVPSEDGSLLVTPDIIRRLQGNLDFQVDTGSTEAVNQQTEQQKWQGIIEQIGKPPFDNLTQQALDEIGTSYLYALRVPNPEAILQHNPPQPPAVGAKESIAINYKDAPPDIQRQMEVAAGFKPSALGQGLHSSVVTQPPQVPNVPTPPAVGGNSNGVAKTPVPTNGNGIVH